MTSEFHLQIAKFESLIIDNSEILHWKVLGIDLKKITMICLIWPRSKITIVP
jgi:hypothetical protein